MATYWHEARYVNARQVYLISGEICPYGALQELLADRQGKHVHVEGIPTLVQAARHQASLAEFFSSLLAAWVSPIDATERAPGKAPPHPDEPVRPAQATLQGSLKVRPNSSPA